MGNSGVSVNGTRADAGACGGEGVWTASRFWVGPPRRN